MFKEPRHYKMKVAYHLYSQFFLISPKQFQNYPFLFQLILSIFLVEFFSPSQYYFKLNLLFAKFISHFSTFIIFSPFYFYLFNY